MWQVENKFRIKLGGNFFRNTDAVIATGSRENPQSVFKLKRREEDGRLAVDFDIYDGTRKRIATIRNSRVMSGSVDARYSGIKHPNRYQLIERKTGKVVCDIKQLTNSEEGVELEIAVDFHTKSGLHIVADADKLRVGNITMSDCEIGGDGSPYAILVG